MLSLLQLPNTKAFTIVSIHQNVNTYYFRVNKINNKYAHRSSGSLIYCIDIYQTVHMVSFLLIFKLNISVLFENTAITIYYMPLLVLCQIFTCILFVPLVAHGEYCLCHCEAECDCYISVNIVGLYLFSTECLTY